MRRSTYLNHNKFYDPQILRLRNCEMFRLFCVFSMQVMFFKSHPRLELCPKPIITKNVWGGKSSTKQAIILLQIQHSTVDMYLNGYRGSWTCLTRTYYPEGFTCNPTGPFTTLGIQNREIGELWAVRKRRSTDLWSSKDVKGFVGQNDPSSLKDVRDGVSVSCEQARSHLQKPPTQSVKTHFAFHHFSTC